MGLELHMMVDGILHRHSKNVLYNFDTTYSYLFTQLIIKTATGTHNIG